MERRWLRERGARKRPSSAPRASNRPHVGNPAFIAGVPGRRCLAWHPAAVGMSGGPLAPVPTRLGAGAGGSPARSRPCPRFASAAGDATEHASGHRPRRAAGGERGRGGAPGPREQSRPARPAAHPGHRPRLRSHRARPLRSRALW